MLADRRLTELAAELLDVAGVVAVLLGGSRARSTHAPDSDVDLGLYYRGPLDTDALAALAREVAGPYATVTRPGEWGPWVDGGGWLRIDDVAVDWIYRDLDRVEAVWSHVQAGRFAFHRQVGHPFGFADFAYVAGCLFHAIVLCAHALHARAGRWLVNEKGAVNEAGTLPIAPPGFAARGHDVLARLGRPTADLDRAIDDAEQLIADTAEACTTREPG